MMLKYLTLTALLLISTLSLGAVVTINKDTVSSEVIIDIDGDIVAGDYSLVRKAAIEVTAMREFNALHFRVDSFGGDVAEALKIGRLARELLVIVEVNGKGIYAPTSEDGKFMADKLKGSPQDSYYWKSQGSILAAGAPIEPKHLSHCYSACVLIFYGGTERRMYDNTDKRNTFNTVNIPTIGVHRPYYGSSYYSGLTPAEANAAYARMEKEVRGYLNEMGAPSSLVDRMFQMKSTDLDLILYKDFKGMYKHFAPFLEEWLIAKCGTTTLNDRYEGVLSDVEAADYKIISDESGKEVLRRNEALGGGWERLEGLWVDVRVSYSPPGYSLDYANKLRGKVVFHNRAVNSCKATSIKKHQQKWAANQLEVSM